MKKKCCHVRMLSPNKSCSKDNLDRVDVQQYNPLIHQQLIIRARVKDSSCNSLCSKCFCACSSRKLGQEQKKMNDEEGGGERRKRLPTNPTIVKTAFAHEHSFWVVQCRLSFDYSALETSIKQGMLCLHASQIWSPLISGHRLQMVWTGIYCIESCLCEGLCDRSLQSINGDRVVETREGQFTENDGVRIWLGVDHLIFDGGVAGFLDC